ncbi:Ldh family oxidoreductase, partial [Asanoa sp. NPDC049573]|uniref:Ldh family oxidoreductase n=1 Tax=Asanoa sp. NPDC049573 TaxID=3155396 RepID=UPI0034293B06
MAELLAASERLLQALGTPPDLAAVVAGALVDAQRVGHESHGVIRLLEYAGFVESGRLDPAARARVERRAGADKLQFARNDLPNGLVNHTRRGKRA